MTVSNSTASQNGALDGRIAAWGADFVLRAYAGAVPADCDAALGGATLLAEVTPTPAAAANGSKDVLGGVKTTTGLADGNATFYRVYNAAGTTCHEQGTLGNSGGEDMAIDNPSIAEDQEVKFNAWVKNSEG